MKSPDYKEAIAEFAGNGIHLSVDSINSLTVEPIGNGLINHSYKVCLGAKPLFLLQQFNKKVFTKPEDVQGNYNQIWKYAVSGSSRLQLPAPKCSDKKTTLFIDVNNNYWRAFEFIEDAITLNVAVKPEQAKATSKAFAKFTAAFHDFDVRLLKNVIPNFHNLSSRYEQMEKAQQGDLYERIAKAQPLIEELKQRERYKHFFEIITESDEFPQRVMHHDAKISNVLFSKTTGRVICPVDFDTVMPGYFFSDLGDMIRSMVSNYDENNLNFDKIKIRKNYYEAIVDGYLSVMGKYFTKSEKKYIHFSGLCMIYMQTLRFLTDFMNGGIYYKVEYKGQNFDRALNQFTLLKRLEDFLKKEYNFTI